MLAATLLRCRHAQSNPSMRLHTSATHLTLWSFLDTPSPSAYNYAQNVSEQEPLAMKTVRQAAIAQDPTEAQKMISPLQGVFLSHLVRSQGARHILELGCYKGYSALWLAHGLRSQTKGNPQLWTCERDLDVTAIAKQNIIDSGYADIVQVLSQPADEVLQGWNAEQKLDMVFIDANKAAYKKYYNLILERDLLKENGQIIVDNVLFHGQVHGLDQDDKTGRKKTIAQKLNDFNKHVADDKRTTQTLLPLFDGLLLIHKI